MSLTSLWCCSCLKILEQAQIFSAGHTITPTGVCIKHKAINPKNTPILHTHIFCIPNWHWYCTSLLFSPDEMFFYVYRLEEDLSLLKEGGERLTVGTLRACSYKAKAEGCHQGLCPLFSSRGFYGFCLFKWHWVNTDSPKKSRTCWKKQKHKKPLVVDTKCLLRATDAASGWKSLSKLRYFQPATSSPFRVLHQPQGDKQR